MNPFQKNVALWLLLAALLSGNAVWANDRCAGQFTRECTEWRVRAADVNGDGTLSFNEFKAFSLAANQVVRSQRAVSDAEFEELYFDARTVIDVRLPSEDETWETVLSLDRAVIYTDIINSTFRPEYRRRLSGRPITLSRRLVDSVDPAGSALNDRPFVVSYRKDQNTSSEGLQILGSVGIPLGEVRGSDAETSPNAGWVRSHALTVGFDVDTFSKNKGREASEVTFSYGLSTRWRVPKKNDTFVEHAFTVAPSYQTDGNGSRDVVSLIGSYSFASENLLRAGFRTPLNRETGVFGWTFTWQPRIHVLAGRVNDSGGNETLAALEAEGAYTRLAPELSLELGSLQHGLAFRADAQWIWVDGGRNRSYREYAIEYTVRPGIVLSVMRRQGARFVSLAPVDTTMVGIGIRLR